MRIGFDAKKIVSNMTGIGNYSRSLVNLLSPDGEDQCLLFTPIEGNARCLSELNITDYVTFHRPDTRNAIGRHLWRNHGIIKDLEREKIDLFHGLSNELPFGIKDAPFKKVVTIHDLIFLRFPHTFDFLSRKILEVKTRYACRVADRIIAISEQTKNDIVNFYGVDPGRIDVLYQGCDKIFKRRASGEELVELRKEYDLPEKFMVAIGTIEDRKNHRRLIEALTHTSTDLPLIILSKKTHLQPEIEELIKRKGLEQRVRIINGVPFAHLPLFYQASQFAIYISYFEGFGLPVLEGLTSGVPVIAATGSCLEEAGGPGAIYCDPHSSSEIAKAIDELTLSENRRQQLVESAQQHLTKFTDEAIRTNLREFYAKVLADK